MALPKVYVTRRIQDAGLSLLPGRVDFEVWEKDAPMDRETFFEKASGVDGLLCTLSDRIDEELFSRCPGLKVASNYAVGFDNIDVAEATRKNLTGKLQQNTFKAHGNPLSKSGLNSRV
jgi:glyoxylate reductase